ncbi:YtpI family protein [Paenibacillus sp. 1001270B_150601_E10]|uniref:YtpI family protein n=1 Tax=Paenibacillus sp. 1001270B_150601_E10 TaxID=2787079 RepID=UPI00189D21F2|nr:YtpI family protein [Paenibacillus sp. 1001270B_150601_E10]
MQVIQTILIGLICVASLSSVFFSFRSRRSQDALLRGLYAARMNISMGLMLIFIAIIQMTMFTGSTVRVIVGAVLLCLGAFNLFAGLRNHGAFQRLLEERGA